jgi:hypothetical protein
MDLFHIENKTYLIDGRGFPISFAGAVIPPYSSSNTTRYWTGALPPEIQTLVTAGHVTVKRLLTEDDSLGGGTGAVIDDNSVAPDKAWSSTKISSELAAGSLGAGTLQLTVGQDTAFNDIIAVNSSGIAIKAIANGTLLREDLEAIYICKDTFIFGGNDGIFYRSGNTVNLTGTKGQRLYLSSSTPGTFQPSAPTSGDVVILGFFRDNNIFEWSPRYVMSL